MLKKQEELNTETVLGYKIGFNPILKTNYELALNAISIIRQNGIFRQRNNKAI